MAYTEVACYVDSVAYAAVALWTTGTAYTVGQRVRQRTTPTVGNERVFICIVAGTAQATEPTWSITRGVITSETTIKWMECTGLPALCGDATSTNAWHASAGAIALGWIIKNTAGTHYFICTTAGNGGTGTEPGWNTTAGATTADNTVTWTCIGAISSFTAAWAAAHASLRPPLNNASNWLLNANMTVFVGDDHSETNISTQTYTPNSTCMILAVDHTAALPPGASALKTGAQINCTAVAIITFNNAAAATQVYIYGLQFINAANATFIISGGTQTRSRMDSCTFASPSGGGPFRLADASTGGVLELKDCTFAITSQTAQQFFSFLAGTIKIENGTFTVTAGTAGLPVLTSLTINTTVTFEGCDFTGVASTQYLVGIVSNAPSGNWVFKDCAIPSGLVVFLGATGRPTIDNATIDLTRVDSGGTAYRNERYNLSGTETTSTSVLRTNGAQDGLTPISHQIVTGTLTNFAWRAFNAIPLAAWNTVAGSNRNATIYGLVNDSRLPNNDEVWFDTEYLGSASSPKGSYVRGGKATVLSTASALSADTSAWDSMATARANSHAYVLGDAIKTASNPGRVFFCTTAGTSAGSEPGGYASAVDGGSVTDGGATFRAGVRFQQTLTMSSPQPQQQGYLYVYARVGRPSMTYYLDPQPVLS